MDNRSIKYAESGKERLTPEEIIARAQDIINEKDPVTGETMENTLKRLDAEDPDGFHDHLGKRIKYYEPYIEIEEAILSLIGAYDPPRESKQNKGGTKVRITESRLREIIKEELSALHEKASAFAADDDPRYAQAPQIAIRRFPRGEKGRYVVTVNGAAVYGGPKGGLGRGWYGSAPRHPKDLSLRSFEFFLEEAHNEPMADFSHELDPSKVKRVDVSMELDGYAEWEASFNASGVVGSPKIKFIKTNFDD